MASADDSFESTRMTLGEHLDELRRRLIVGTVAVLIAFIASWIYKDVATRVVLWPYERFIDMYEVYYRGEVETLEAEDPDFDRSKYYIGEDSDRLIAFRDTRMQAVGPAEKFVFELKICLYLALFLGAPVLLWQLWRFIGAGLYAKERRVVMRYFPLSVLLFLLGIAFGYFGLVPYGMYYLNSVGSIENLRPDFRAREYFAFLNSLCLALGGVFQLPIVMTCLAKLDLIEPVTFAKYRGHMLVGSFVLAALLTPPDPVTQLMMAVPVFALYEVGIWSSRVAAPKRRT